MEQSLILIYFMLFIHVMQEHNVCLIGTWSDHPGKPNNHKTYGSVLDE
jgi:hypothetical protein